MNRFSCLALLVSIGLAPACSTGMPTGSDTSALAGRWGSDEASLTIAKGGATLQILASGGCFGSYGEMNAPIPTGQFTQPGTYTQLTGAAPGKIQYAAQFFGSVAGDMMSIQVGVPALQQSFGPFHLMHGIETSWVACMYP